MFTDYSYGVQIRMIESARKTGTRKQTDKFIYEGNVYNKYIPDINSNTDYYI